MMLDQPHILKRYKKKKHARQIVQTMMQVSSSIVARTNFLHNNSNKLLKRSLNTKNKSKIYRLSTSSSPFTTQLSSCSLLRRSRISEESLADIKTNCRNAQIRWTLLRTNQNNLTKKINNLGRTFRNSNNNIKFRCKRFRTTLKDL